MKKIIPEIVIIAVIVVVVAFAAWPRRTAAQSKPKPAPFTAAQAQAAARATFGPMYGHSVDLRIKESTGGGLNIEISPYIQGVSTWQPIEMAAAVSALPPFDSDGRGECEAYIDITKEPRPGANPTDPQAYIRLMPASQWWRIELEVQQAQATAKRYQRVWHVDSAEGSLLGDKGGTYKVHDDQGRTHTFDFRGHDQGAKLAALPTDFRCSFTPFPQMPPDQWIRPEAWLNFNRADHRIPRNPTTIVVGKQ